MKWFSAVMLTAIISWFSLVVKGQGVKVKTIPSCHLSVGYNKTSNLIFPYAVKSVDRGSGSVLAQKAKAADNILQVKAAYKNFEQTNLSIVTSDGQFYSIVLSYEDDPPVLNFSFSKDLEATPESKASVTDQLINEDTFRTLKESILEQYAFMNKTAREQLMRLRLKGIYLKQNIMWFKLELKNKSMIDYLPASVRFFVQDKKRNKRAAVQQTEVQPLYDCKATAVIKGNEMQQQVFAVHPFTIPSSKVLVVQVREENSGRLLELRISHRQLLKARLL